MTIPGIDPNITDAEWRAISNALQGVGFECSRIERCGDDGAWEILTSRIADRPKRGAYWRAQRGA